MSGGHDPSNPHGGPGGWSAPPQHPPGPQDAAPVPGYGAPAPQGWSPPAQQAPPAPAGGWTAPPPQPSPQGGWTAPPQQPSPQGGWTAPPQQPSPQGGWTASQPAAQQPASQGWNAPAASLNARAQWAETSPQVRSPTDRFFKAPPELPESKRGIYKLLTIAAGPLLVFCFFAFYMFKARYRRHGVTGFFAIYAHFLGTVIFASIFFWIGGAFGFDGWYLAAPMVVLAWIPLAARYALWKLV